MNVYILETGCYEDRAIIGIYATADAAMAAHSPSRPSGYGGEPWSYEWSEDAASEDIPRTWSFGADWNAAATVIEYEVQGEDLCPICGTPAD